MLKFLDQSFGMLFIGGAVGAALGFASLAVDAIAAIVSPYAIGLLVAFSLSTLLVAIKKKQFEFLKPILPPLGIGALVIFGAFFAFTVVAPTDGPNAAFAAMILAILPWCAVVVSFCLMLMCVTLPGGVVGERE